MISSELMHEESWRMWRIMAEFADGFETMAQYKNLVSVFGSARIKEDDPVYQDCVRLGELLAENGYGVVSGGGPGIMEAANRGAMNRNGVSIGLNIKLPMEQHPNVFQTEAIDFRYFFIRKVCFTKYAVAVVAYPGGLGTLDEFSEVITLIQTRKINRIPYVLVGREFWSGFVKWLKKTLEGYKLISPDDLEIFKIVDNAQEACDYIVDWHDKMGVRKTTRDDV